MAEAVPELGCVSERRGLLFLAIVYYLWGYAGNFVAEFGIDGAIEWLVWTILDDIDWPTDRGKFLCLSKCGVGRAYVIELSCKGGLFTKLAFWTGLGFNEIGITKLTF